MWMLTSLWATLTFTVPSALNRGVRRRSYLPHQAFNPARLHWSLTICHTLLENRSFYLHDKLWILAGPPGPRPGRARSVRRMFPHSREEHGLCLVPAALQLRHLRCGIPSRSFPLGFRPVLGKVEVCQSAPLSWMSRQGQCGLPTGLQSKPVLHLLIIRPRAITSAFKWKYFHCRHGGLCGN